MLSADEIRKKYQWSLSRSGPSPTATCDKCKRKLCKVGTKKMYTYGYRTQYCSQCIVPIVKSNLREKKARKDMKKVRKKTTKRRNRLVRRKKKK